MGKYVKRLCSLNSELLWAVVWRDTINEIPWLEDKIGISPGRWGVGYNYVYVMSRILEAIKPRTVLDCGFGISSKLISQYFEYYKYSDSKHVILEHDEEWVKFYGESVKLSASSRIYMQKLVVKRRGWARYPAYEDVSKDIGNMKFNVISVDAPYGGEWYSRRDILDVLPQILEESWVIVLDDVNRKGERKTIGAIRKILDNSKIKYVSSIYQGEADCCVIASIDNKFLCSL